MDHRRFLGRSHEAVAPVVRRRAWLDDRAVRIDAADGWWRVRASGRRAAAIGPAEPEEVAAALARLPIERGPALRLGGAPVLVHGGRGVSPVELAPADEEPALFAPLRARRLDAAGLLLWDGVEWEGQAEEAARQALEDRRGMAEVKGASSALRAAFAFATAAAASGALAIPAAPVELLRWVRDIAEEGPPAAQAALRALAAEREAWARRAAPPARPPAPVQPVPDVETRIEESLRGSGAQLLHARRIGAGVVEVRWMFLGQRFVTLVSETGLRVYDAGVCLAGSDQLVALDALPGVIREAIEEGLLVITRHDER